MSSTLVEIQTQLQKALAESAKAQSDYDAAVAKLEPLKQAAHAKQTEVNSLISAFRKATGVEVPARGRRGSSGPRKTYNISNESKIAASGKRAYTRSIKGGATEKDAKAAQKAAEKALTEKLGVAK